MKKVLIIDDDIFLTGLYKKLLRKEGLEVAVANSGSEGVELIGYFHPDLIVLDLHMPGMHGTDVLQAIRNDSNFKHIRVIVFATGYIKNLINAVADLGAYKVLSKMNCKPRALVEEVKESLIDVERVPVSPPVRESHVMTLEAGAAQVEDTGIEQLDIWVERLLSDERVESRRICLLHLYRMIQHNVSCALKFDVQSAEYKLGIALKELMQDLFEKPQLVTDSTAQSLKEAINKFLGLAGERHGQKLDSEAALQQLMKRL